MPGGGGPNGPCPAPGRVGDDQSGAELYPPGTAGYLCGGDIMDAFVKLVTVTIALWLTLAPAIGAARRTRGKKQC
jgi:hypothetical protein